jgi:serine/threonine protein kinase
MKFAESGTLKDVLTEFRTDDRKLSEDMVKNMFKQLTAGLKYLHDNKVFHKDIHLNSILVFNDLLLMVIIH